MNQSQKILIVEDDIDIAELLKVNLEDLAYECDICHRGDEAVSLITEKAFDLVILDLTLPGLCGLDVCKQVREIKPEQSILILTAKSSEVDQIIGLEVGADDYMTKPFSIPALQARVRARIRRSQLYHQAKLKTEINNVKVRVGDLVLDAAQRKACFAKHPLDLTALEFDLLKYFVSHPEQVFSRTQLLDKVWGYDHEGYEHTVNSHINRLRNKLELAVKGKAVIQTVWGVGYRLSSKNCQLSN
ncbi:response regulator transcription factor [Aliikangiella sp. IMCC44359]|uniref:response regulator transcription factor n=1 Tax=Aliikangiella sp. IMCC44359 TaxID=3459125 RepID=UPI00403B05A1